MKKLYIQLLKYNSYETSRCPSISQLIKYSKTYRPTHFIQFNSIHSIESQFIKTFNFIFKYTILNTREKQINFQHTFNMYTFSSERMDNVDID